MLINLVKTKMPDIVILEEIDQSWYNELEKSLTDYKVYKAVPRDDNFGIAVFSKIPMAIKVKYIGSARVPSLECLIEEDDDEIILWATHPVPPISDEYWHLRNEQLRELSALISGSDCQVVVAGDFNTSPWSRCFNGLKAAKLDDTAAGIGVQASWPAMWPAFMRIPIDHVLISKEIKVIERCVLEDIGSDHLPVFVRLQLK
ncbi:MAG: endonuclease/exonuclease/phosphatase family protein [Thermodesulfovibrionia bacterium]|nr:endonuclease/exonuclease/phosphatase family protein [Thermodesulfovibrionia bacterium]